jgi:hypothetical protein
MNFNVKQKKSQGKGNSAGDVKERMKSYVQRLAVKKRNSQRKMRSLYVRALRWSCVPNAGKWPAVSLASVDDRPQNKHCFNYE